MRGVPAEANPFRTARLEALEFVWPPGTGSWEQLLARLHQLGGRGAVVGPHGSGKTTLLEQLGPHLEQRGYRVRRVVLRADQPTPTRAALDQALDGCAGGFVLFDGAGHLPWWRWGPLRRRLARAAGVVITTHWPGRLPTLLRTHTSPQLLAELVSRLDPANTSGDLVALHRSTRGDLRAALLTLYDARSRGE